MATNSRPMKSSINTGANIMTGVSRSPSLNTLRSRSVGDVAPNEEQNLATLASTEVAPIEANVPSPVTEAPEVQTQQVVAEESAVGEQPSAATSVNPVTEGDPMGPIAIGTLPSTTEENPIDDPFADAVDVRVLSETYDLDGESAFGSALDGEDIKEAYATEEERTFTQIASDYYDNLNKVSYGVAKGIAGTLDLATVPGWALAHVTVGGSKFPFTGFLEEFYPEKDFKIAGDDSSYVDEALRLSQTGAEFISGGVVVNAGAKTLTKGAYDVSQKMDAIYSGASALGYQGSLEMGASEGFALLASFLAPVSPQLVQASYNVSKAGAAATGNASLWLLDKTTSFVPGASLFKSEIKATAKEALQVQKQKLLADDKMWTDTFLKRQARSLVLKTKDTVKTQEEQMAEVANIQRWINAAFPDTPELRAHIDNMRKLQDSINAELPEGSKVNFTLEQLYAPLLREQNADSGLKEVMESVRITNSEAYNQQVIDNRKHLMTYLENNKEKIGPEETQAFMAIFKQEADDLLKVQETIYGMSRNIDMIDPAKSTGYRFPEEAVTAELRPVLENIRGLMDSAYSAALNRMPKDAEIDTTPVADAITDIYDSLGLFARPESIPPYLKVLVQGLQTNASTGSSTASKLHRTNILNTSEELKVKNAALVQLISDTSLAHKKAVVALGDDKKAIKALKLQQAEEMSKLRQQHLELMQARKDVSISKRNEKVAAATAVTGVEGLPQPNLVTVGDITEGLRSINVELRKAFDSKDRDKIDTLLKLKDSLDESLQGLGAIDADAYAFFKETNDQYKRFVSTDFNESLAADTLEVGDHLYKLVSEDVVNRLWDNAGTEGMMRFLRNFDGSREGFSNFLSKADVPEDPNATLAMDLYSKEAEAGVKAMQNVVWTSLAQKVRAMEVDFDVDPVVRMDKLKKTIVDFANKHESKLVQLPGFETFGENIQETIKTLAKYKQALDVVEERRNLKMLRDVVGPGKTINDIVHNDIAAQEMDDFLNNRLTKVDIEGITEPMVQEATASKIRKSLSKSFLNEYTSDGKINFKALDVILGEGTATRNRLSLVLGESEVLKLDAFREVGRAMNEGTVTFTQVLMQNTTLRNLENLGLPLGRIGSLLQRRAVFTPSGAYVAGAVVSKMLDSMGSRQTSRALQLLVERPLDILNMDQILINEMKKLPENKRRLLDDVMSGTTRHMRELKSWLPKAIAPALTAHTATLGYTYAQSEVEAMVNEVLNTDDRHPEFNVVPPVKQEIDLTVNRAPEVPALLQRPEEQLDVSQEAMDSAAAQDPLHEVTNATGEGIITDGMSADEATYAKALDKFITVRGQGISKEQALKMLEILGDNNNKEILKKALKAAYKEEKAGPSKKEE